MSELVEQIEELRLRVAEHVERADRVHAELEELAEQIIEERRIGWERVAISLLELRTGKSMIELCRDAAE